MFSSISLFELVNTTDLTHSHPRRRYQGASRDRPPGGPHLHQHDQGGRPLRPGKSGHTVEDRCKLTLLPQISQAFAGLDTNRSVGVFGDQRVWGYIVILRAVRTKDFMSAEVFDFSNSFLQVSQVLVIFRAPPRVGGWVQYHGPNPLILPTRTQYHSFLYLLTCLL